VLKATNSIAKKGEGDAAMSIVPGADMPAPLV
jgi:hypothetical protein